MPKVWRETGRPPIFNSDCIRSLPPNEPTMIHPRTVLRTLAMAAAILGAGCTDDSGPTAPSSPAGAPLISKVQQVPSDDPNALGRSVAGFGGFFFDADGRPTVYLTDPGRRRLAERALAPFLQAHGLSPSQLAVRRGDFDYSRLESWFTEVAPAALAVPGSVFADLDEASNRLRIGVEHAAALTGVRQVLAARGVPATAAIVEQTEPIRYAATLRNKVRPVLGGLQINFTQFICTLGFNAVRSGVNSFVTASHCSAKQGGVQSTLYYQPLSTTSNSFIGTEVSDPAYLSGIAGCPAGRRCRFSDAARAKYASGVSFTLGRLEKTTGANNGSVTIGGSFAIGSEGGGSVGNTANKVGRTTGWSQGKITNTCVTVNVSGTSITQLCQNLVSARVGAGDSGSPVFLGANNATVKLAGILWGSNPSGTSFVYSPMSGIEKDLGSLTTF
jgi:hypothetical protein